MCDFPFVLPSLRLILRRSNADDGPRLDLRQMAERRGLEAEREYITEYGVFKADATHVL